MAIEAATSYPLYWPTGWKRTQFPKRSNFAPTTVHRESRNLLNEIALVKGASLGQVVISSNMPVRNDGIPYANQKRPKDVGVAVWFVIDGEERVLACDKWDWVEHNLRAIVKHISALRGQERWGVGSLEQAFRGYAALPSGSEPRPWRAVLGFLEDETVRPEDIEGRFRELAMKKHPDRGGTDQEFAEIAVARKAALDSYQGDHS